jgi:lysophospholipase L1-like esterase
MGLLDVPYKNNDARVIACQGTPVTAFVKQDTAYTDLANFTLLARDIPAGCMIRVYGCISMRSTTIGGKNIALRFAGSLIQTATIGASDLTVDFEQYYFVTADKKTIRRAKPYLACGTAAAVDAKGITYGGNTSSLPTNVSVDMTQNQTLQVQVKVNGSSTAGEYIQLDAFVVEVLKGYSGDIPTTLAPANSVHCWGDSLTQGSGSTAWNDYPSALSKLKRVPYYNGGIAGETAQQIVARMLLDPIHVRNGTVVLWMGRNNVTGSTPTATILAQLAIAVAALGHTRYVILTVTNASDEPSGSANFITIAAINAAIIAAYPNNYLDIRAVLATDPGSVIPAALRSDTIHLNDAGNLVVATSVDAFLTGKGW